MGKGGESNEAQAARSHKDSYNDAVLKKAAKLNALSVDELKGWSKAYGLPEMPNPTKESLLINLAPYADGITAKGRPANLPLERPPFTLGDIISAIPKHCFKRSLFTSLSHLFSDAAIIAILFYFATHLDHSPYLPVWSKFILWPMYWYAQGSVMTGVWVLAHECGHQGFSESELANNIVGTICHSLLLVPYHPWRITHGLHHGNTGSCENDEVFAPATRADWANEMLRDTPIMQLWGIFLMLTVGWMPGYLVWNFSGPAKYRGKNANHFSPTAAFYTADHYSLVVQSDIAFFIAVGLLGFCVYTFGFLTVAKFYLIPYVITNYHLVLITYLQHTDVYMPHFRAEEWDWLRGALCTVDRSFGPLLDHTFHHITDTHVCHHLFSKMPFYHAQEATEAIRKVLGPYYLKDDTPIAVALYRSFSNCLFVEDEGNIVFYKNVK